MLTRIFIPIAMFLLCCSSGSAVAGPPHQHAAHKTSNTQVHVHIDQHCGVAHLHTHSGSNPSVTDNPHHACDEENDSDHHSDHDCCSDHHESESSPVASLPRSQDLPTGATQAALPILYPNLQLIPNMHTRWSPARQRPPNHLVLLRTFVMLN